MTLLPKIYRHNYQLVSQLIYYVKQYFSLHSIFTFEMIQDYSVINQLNPQVILYYQVIHPNYSQYSFVQFNLFMKLFAE